MCGTISFLKKLDFFLFDVTTPSLLPLSSFITELDWEDEPIFPYSDSPCRSPWPGPYLIFHQQGMATSRAPTAAVLHLKPKGQIAIVEIFCNLKSRVELPNNTNGYCSSMFISYLGILIFSWTLAWCWVFLMKEFIIYGIEKILFC